MRAASVEAALRGQPLTPETIAQAAALAAEDVELMADLYAGPEYRAQLVRAYARRALLDALPA